MSIQEKVAKIGLISLLIKLENIKKSKECKMFIGTEVKIKDFKGSLDINNSIKKNVILLWLVF